MSKVIYNEKLQRQNNNMDAVRYLLAVSVIIAHFNTLCGCNIPWPISSATGVSGFFTISGFLVFRSYLRNRSIKHFIESRARRILPPYFLIVIVCALLFVTVSTLNADDYYFSRHWFKYLISNLTFMNFIEPSLPGVFDGSRFYTTAVNGSLWTMKVEWGLYFSVPIVACIMTAMSSKWQAKKIHIFMAIVVVSILYRYLFSIMYENTGKYIYEILSRQVFGQLSYFYVGVIVYFYFDTFLSFKRRILCVCIGLMLIADHIPYYGIFIRPFVEGGIVLWFSLVGSWGKYISSHNNISYDMYLSHFPIIQLAVFVGREGCNEYALFMAVTLIIVIYSFLSYNCVGRFFIKQPYKKMGCV